MAVNAPNEIHAAFAAALNALDLEAVMSLYDQNATLVAGPGQFVHGAAAIREGLSAYLASKPLFELKSSTVIQSGDVALMLSRWVVTEISASGETTTSVIEPTQVARRQADGTWRLAIDKPSRVD